MSGIRLDFVHESLFEYVDANTGKRQTRRSAWRGSKCSRMCDFSPGAQQKLDSWENIDPLDAYFVNGEATKLDFRIFAKPCVQHAESESSKRLDLPLYLIRKLLLRFVSHASGEWLAGCVQKVTKRASVRGSAMKGRCLHCQAHVLLSQRVMS